MNLTPGERFLIQRRRLGQPRAVAARRWGVTPRRVREWEFDRGNIPPPRIDLLPAQLSPAEACYIHRRRAGLEAEQIGMELGISGRTVLKREQGIGDVDQLLNYWRQRGAA